MPTMPADARSSHDVGRSERLPIADRAPRPIVPGMLVVVSTIGGWLVLATLGPSRMPLQAGGLAAIAVWLAATGLTRQALRIARPTAMFLRLVVLASSLVALWALDRTLAGVGSPALLVAAIGWGMSLGASWASLPMRVTADPVSATRPASTSHGSTWWLAWSARWSMLPMMASLIFMTGWCGDAWGLSASASIALHLGAMLLPALIVRLFRIDAPLDGWIAIAMAAGLVASFALPLLPALAAASLCQSVACSLAWAPRHARPLRRAVTTGVRPWLVACLPAACIWILGSTIADRGPLALLDVQRGIGLFAVGCLVASACGAAAFTTRLRS